MKNFELRKQKTANAQNLTQFSKTNTNKKTFWNAKSSLQMEIALIKTEPRINYHQVINNSQQQEQNRETETAERAEK